MKSFRLAWKRAMVVFALLLAVAVARRAAAAEPSTAEALRQLNPNVLAAGESLASMLADDVQTRLSEANRRELAAWRAVRTREDWEHFRDSRLAALRQSLGEFDPAPRSPQVWSAGVLEGNGYRIEKFLYDSVTANLYVPADPPKSMPGILICHSHHNAKTQGELQDMGVMWARQGCLVLVIDQLGHGERRQHPFRSAADYPGEFRLGRQDYYFRYNVGIQLQLAGESLMGCMVSDLRSGVSYLLNRPDIDRRRIILLGAVAGGGDPAAVTAALDPRITAVAPFNFGGPQPESPYPLPDDAAESFDYAGGGSWESTRNLRLSARDGFLPWVIVGSIAPRRLIYGHEFSWDRERDPVWRQLQAIYSFYEAPDNLAFAHGFGLLSGQPPEASHCNNIGAPHRKMIHAALERWFKIPVPKEDEEIDRHAAEELLCLGEPDAAEKRLAPLHRLLAERVTPLEEFADRSRSAMRAGWSKLLGDIKPYPIVEAESRQARQDWQGWWDSWNSAHPTTRAHPTSTAHRAARLVAAAAATGGDETMGEIRVERLLLHGERKIRLPVLLLIPQRPNMEKLPLVVAVAQDGKAGFLAQRAEWLAALLDGGAAVCLPDLRGTGETRPDDERGRQSEATSLSASELMLGQTLVGLRFKDLRSLLAWLRERPEFDSQRIALCGDSFAPVNSPDDNLNVPLDVDQPHLAEPLGSLLALLGGLFEDDLAAISAYGGLIGYRSILHSQFIHVPHDAIVPGALQAGDLSDIASALAPRPLWLCGFVDGLNRRVSDEEARGCYGAGTNLTVAGQDVVPGEMQAQWLLERLRDH